MRAFEVAGMPCLLLGTGAFSVDAETVFATAPADELAVARARFDCAKNPLVFQVHPLFVETDSHRVVVDPGTTEDGSSLVDELSAAGIAPESIDTVVITHGHADHWSASVAAGADGREHTVAVFPNARYVIQHDEWEHWHSDPNPEPHHAATFRQLLGPIRDRFDLVKGDCEVVPGLELWPTPGHSPAHQVVVIGGRAVHVGDVLIHPICVERPEWTAAFDVWPDGVVASREALLRRIVAEDLLVITHHFPWPGIGRVREVRGARRWEYTG
jgi:glyoxylase-like metal-dependent hydrolase (beta-lactamase superfamily II)